MSYNSINTQNSKILIKIISFIIISCLLIGLYKSFVLPHIYNWFTSRKSTILLKNSKPQQEITKPEDSPEETNIYTETNREEEEEEDYIIQEGSYTSDETAQTIIPNENKKELKKAEKLRRKQIKQEQKAEKKKIKEQNKKDKKRNKDANEL